MLPMASDVEVIHSPGHCAGHIALLLRHEGVLIAGQLTSVRTSWVWATAF